MMRINVFGVKVQVSFMMILLMTLSVVTAGVGQTLVLLCFFSAVLHELGHLIFIYTFNGKPDKIEINLFEVKICSDIRLSSKRKDVIITFAGIAFNLLFSAFAGVIYCFYHNRLVVDFILCNLCVAFINLLPIQSFDGGQLLYLFLTEFISEKSAFTVVFVLTIVLMFPLFIAGVFVLFTSQHNYSLLFVFLYLLSIFISKELR